MSNWQPASQVVDLADLFVEESAFGAYAELPPEQEPPKEREYFAMIAGNRVGPYPLSLLRQMGVTRDTPVWTAGMSNWQPAYSVAEVFAAISGTPNFSNSQGSPSPFQTSVHTNWLPWAIVATIAGFLCSCIGAVFGIIGIVNANKANTFYAQGDEASGNQANNTAKIMTIISLVVAGVGLIGSIYMLSMNALMLPLSL
jgi:hypothetical protein